MDNNLQPQMPPYARRRVSPVTKKIIFLFVFIETDLDISLCIRGFY